MKSQIRILYHLYVTCLIAAGQQAAYCNSTSVAQPVISEGKCLYFDGIDDVVNAGSIDAFNDLQQMTAEMWVRIDRFDAWRTFFCKFKNLGNRIQFQQYSDPGKIAVVVNNGADLQKEGNQGYFYTPYPEVTVGDWFHLAMVFDGTQAENERLKIYINGMIRPLKKDAASMGKVPTHIPSTDAPLLFGAEKANGSYGFKGLMDEIRIWTVARSAEQIRTNMERQLSGNEEGLRLYYTIDAFDDSVKTLNDKSSAKLIAKLVNFDPNACFVDREVAIPATAASEAKVEAPSHNSIRIAWVRGSGSANLVFATDRDSGLPQPQAGVTYTANPEYGKGSRIGETNWYCIYNGYEAEASVGGLTPATNYRLSIVDYNGAPGSEQYKVNSTSVLSVTTAAAPVAEKKTQEIVFTFDSALTLTDTPVKLGASASSGLPVTYMSSDTSVAAVIDNFLQIHSAGTVTITATQTGDDAWLPAADISRILIINNAQPVSEAQKPPLKGSRNLTKTKPFLIGGAAVITTGILIGVITAVYGANDNGGNSPATVDDQPPHDPGIGMVP